MKTAKAKLTPREKLLAIVSRYPGLSGLSLKGKGWRPEVHGSLRQAEADGAIVFRNGGWYVTGSPDNSK